MPAQSCSAANSPRRNMPSMYSKESTEDGSTPQLPAADLWHAMQDPEGHFLWWVFMLCCTDEVLSTFEPD